MGIYVFWYIFYGIYLIRFEKMGKYVFCCMDMMYEYNYNDNPMIFWNKYREKYHGLFELSKSVYIIQSSSCASVYKLNSYYLRTSGRLASRFEPTQP